MFFKLILGSIDYTIYNNLYKPFQYNHLKNMQKSGGVAMYHIRKLL